MSQATSWNSLIHSLLAERDAYLDLSRLLTEEHAQLVMANRERLRDVTHQKEQILSSIRQLEQVRTVQVKHLTGVQTLRELMEWLKRNHITESKQVRAALDKLLDIGKQVKLQSEKNATLIFRGLYVVREALSLLYSGLGTQPVYGDSGQLTFPSVATSLNLQG